MSLRTLLPVARRYDLIILSACLLLEIIGIWLLYDPNNPVYTLLLVAAPATLLLLIARLLAPRLSHARRDYWFGFEWLFAPFEQPFVPASLVQRTTDIIRLLVGIFTVYMYLDSLGYAFLQADPGPFAMRHLVFIGLGALLSLGLFTPLVCLAMIVVLNATGLPLGYLFNRALLQAFMVIFLLLGAGRLYSLDTLLMRRRAFGWLAALYRFLPVPTPKNFALARFLIVAVYWGISVMAMRGHLQENYWRSLEALQIIFTAPWLTDHYGLYESLRQASPQLSYLVLAVVILGQMINELFLLPLFFFKWGRVFAALQWLGFSLGSIYILTVAANVPQFEIFLWVLVFLPGIIAGLRRWREPNPTADSRAPVPPRHQYALAVTLIAGYLIAFYIGVVGITFVRRSFHPAFTAIQNDAHALLGAQPFQKIALLVGQIGHFDVYNTYDINASSAYAVIAETDPAGNILRLVPFFDYYGGRLDMIANNYMVYYEAAPWQRSDPDMKRANMQTVGDGSNYLRDMIHLDMCLTDNTDAANYRLYLFERPMEQGEYTYYWRWEPTLVAITDYVITQADYDYIGAQRAQQGDLPCFNLPPGQWRSAERTADTLALLQGAEADYLDAGGAVVTACFSDS